jgi:hypothetical protein
MRLKPERIYAKIYYRNKLNNEEESSVIFCNGYDLFSTKNTCKAMKTCIWFVPDLWYGYNNY